jgi:mannonate dehydratase
MQMTFRWYGEGNDPITLQHIKQIPGVEGIVWSLHDKLAGEVWETERINTEVKTIRDAGFNVDVVESVNVSEAIKQGIPERDEHIANYIKTIERLGQAGVKMITYNCMPVLDWFRSEMFHPNADGSRSMYYEKRVVEAGSLEQVMSELTKNTKGLTMPGWEPERLAHLKSMMTAYEHITTEDLWDNIAYFINAIMPTAEKYGIKMGTHPDDPPWSIFGLPRIITNEENLARFLAINDSPSHCLCLCAGSLGASKDNDIPKMIRRFAGRIAFGHVRNVKHFDNGDFVETSHRALDGDVNTIEIMKAYHDIGYEGYLRPDHGRSLWGETGRPGYGLYDRAMGIMYLLGAWDMLESQRSA